MVPFLFNHTLSFVTFSANYDDEDNILPDGCYLRIDELILYNLVGTNTLVLNSSSGDDYFSWGASASAMVMEPDPSMYIWLWAFSSEPCVELL